MNSQTPKFVLPLAAGAALVAGIADARAAGAVCDGYETAGPAVEEIRRLEQAGAASNVTGLALEDAERLFAPGYVSVAPDGSVSQRDKVMTAFAGGRSVPWAQRFDVTELDVKVYCDAAIAVGLSEVEAKTSTGEIRNAHFRWLNVWTRSAQGWRLSATQFARY